MASPTAAEWKAAKECQNLLLAYMDKNNKSTGIPTIIPYTVQSLNIHFCRMAVLCWIILPSEASGN
jgi:hypothetical protein